MGALEFRPSHGPADTASASASASVDVSALVELASNILTQRNSFHGAFTTEQRGASLQDILRVGTSAGGARANAIIAWNEKTNEVHSGQVEAGKGFSYWLLKFNGVAGNKDKELDDPAGYGLIEQALRTIRKLDMPMNPACHLESLIVLPERIVRLS